MNTALIMFGLSILMTSQALASTSQYSCIGRQAVGLHYDRKPRSWSPALFAPSRYTLRKLTLEDQDSNKQRFARLLSDYPHDTWALFKTTGSEALPIAACAEGAPGSDFRCDSIAAVAQFSPASLRFQVIHGAAYMQQGAEVSRLKTDAKGLADDISHQRTMGPDTPDDLVIEIGDCSIL